MGELPPVFRLPVADDCRRCPPEAFGHSPGHGGLSPSAQLASQRHTFNGNVVQETRVGVELGVRPFRFPHGQRLDADASVEQDVMGAGSFLHQVFRRRQCLAIAGRFGIPLSFVWQRMLLFKS